MINRALLRIKIIQLLYANFQNPNLDTKKSIKELHKSVDEAYRLYHYLLSLVIDLTYSVYQKIDLAKQKYMPTEADLNPNMRFVENRFAAQLAKNKALRSFMDANKDFSWQNYPVLLKNMYDKMVSSEMYVAYMNAEESSFEEDKKFWSKLLRLCVCQNEDLEAVLEEQSIYWNDDLEIVLSFALKTIRRFEEQELVEEFEKGEKKMYDEQVLLPKFKDKEDEAFAEKLYTKALENKDAYIDLISEGSKNWKLDRIAEMDKVIMVAALSEISNFPTIPLTVSLNEYIEIAKTYSSEESPAFINGVLNNVATKLIDENKIMKVKIISNNNK